MQVGGKLELLVQVGGKLELLVLVLVLVVDKMEQLVLVSDKLVLLVLVADKLVLLVLVADKLVLLVLVADKLVLLVLLLAGKLVPERRNLVASKPVVGRSRWEQQVAVHKREPEEQHKQVLVGDRNWWVPTDTLAEWPAAEERRTCPLSSAASMCFWVSCSFWPCNLCVCLDL